MPPRNNGVYAHTFGAGSFGLQSAGNISFSFSFSVFGLTKVSEAENGTDVHYTEFVVRKLHHKTL